MTTLVLSSEECEKLLDNQALIDALTNIHIALSNGEASQPVPRSLTVADDDQTRVDRPLLTPMIARWNGLAAVKLLSDTPANRELGLPAQRSTVALYDADTAECLALIDGRALTRIRTASATALATSRLARSKARVLGLIGAGQLATEHVRSHAHLGFDEIVVWSRSDASARNLREQVMSGVSVSLATSPREVLNEADVVCTLTPSLKPLVNGVDLRPGIHVNAVGSPPRRAYSELAPDVFARAGRIVVDAKAIAMQESGNVVQAIEHGALAPAALVELGDVLAGTTPGRLDDREITLFNSVGLGLQDLVAAQVALQRAGIAHGGVRVALRT